MGDQLTIFPRTDPTTCEYRRPTTLAGIDRCAAHEGTYVKCSQSLFGEPPRCSFEPLDNSPEAVARRVRWREGRG